MFPPADVTNSKRRTDGRNYAYNQLNGFRCKGCKGKADVSNNRVRVIHKPLCPIATRMALTHPQLRRIMDKYRERWN